MKRFSLLAVFLACVLAPTSALASTKTVILNTPSKTLQTWTVPGDFQSIISIEVIGAGASGASYTTWNAGGGGGGAYSKITSISLTPGQSVSYITGYMGTWNDNINSPGYDGGDTFFNGTTCAGASVCAKGGFAGGYNIGGAGGAAAGGVGEVRYSGGSGSSVGGGGGGGAAGPNGNGNNGSGTTGGNGDAGAGGLGGPQVNGNPTGAGGQEFQPGAGAGGGGGTSGQGGPYGGGGGGGGVADAGGGPYGTSGGIAGSGIVVIKYNSACVFTAGDHSITYATVGNACSFTVPPYGTLTAQVWGGGGSGALRGTGGTAGNSTTIFSLNAGGGRAGGFGVGGTGGTASGGDINTAGNPGGTSNTSPPGGNGGSAPNGGAGGAGSSGSTPAPGAQPGGGAGGATSVNISSGGGGSGGYVKKTYIQGASGAPLAGANALTNIGAGGSNGSIKTGGDGMILITWTDPVPSCSVTVTQNPISYGNSTTLKYAATNTTSFYINNIGYVGASGSTTVSPLSATDYTGTATGPYGTVTCPVTLAVGPNVSFSQSKNPTVPNESFNLTWSSVNATACTATNFTMPASEAGSPTTIYLMSGSSWNVPSDWNSGHNTIEVIGAGASGGGNGRRGGGGGAYSKVSNAALTPGNAVSYSVGSGGGYNGGDTFFCNSSSNCGSLGGSAVIVGAQGGFGGDDHAGGAGGWYGSGVGTVRYSGGSAGDNTSVAAFGSGGGGAAGPHGNGMNSADAINGTCAVPGAAGSNGGSGDANYGGAGGHYGFYGGQPWAGDNGTEFDASHGSGGGGGGGSDDCSTAVNGGTGGWYGGGGGGAGRGGAGGSGTSGLIVITYYKLSALPNTSGTVAIAPSTGVFSYGISCTGALSTSTSLTHTVSSNPAPACALSVTPTSILRGQNSSLSWTSTNATGGTISPTVGAVSPSGSASVAPLNTTTYTGSFTGVGGTSACTPATLTVTCAPIYSCSGQTIQYTDASCTTSNVATCVAPASCQSGQSVCINPDPVFQPGSGTSGHLQVRPHIVRTGGTAKLFWNVANVQSCTVNGSNGDSISPGCAAGTCTSGSSGALTSAIVTSVNYTLSCTAYSGGTPATIGETVTVLPSPTYQEQ